jgi:hypothetical protein
MFTVHIIKSFFVLELDLELVDSGFEGRLVPVQGGKPRISMLF